jgi:hypothetical protein
VQRIYFFGSSVKSVKTDDFAAREIIVFSHFRLMSVCQLSLEMYRRKDFSLSLVHKTAAGASTAHRQHTQ